MAAPPTLARRLSVAEYAQLLDESEEKYEYFDGEVYRWEAMAGTTDEHAAICGNLQRELDNGFIRDGRACQTLNSDAMTAIRHLRRYRFPDITVQCGPAELDPELPRARLNPTILIEVLSESSREQDLGVKFAEYERLASLRDYVVVEQDFPLVEVYSREDAAARWTVAKYFRLESEVYFPSVDVRVPLGEIYRNITWEGRQAKFVPGAGIPAHHLPLGGM